MLIRYTGLYNRTSYCTTRIVLNLNGGVWYFVIAEKRGIVATFKCFRERLILLMLLGRKDTLFISEGCRNSSSCNHIMHGVQSLLRWMQKVE
jgi:hypothetical protein